MYCEKCSRVYVPFERLGDARTVAEELSPAG